jgi:hypothetical protein
MLPEPFAVVGALIASLGGLYYLLETLRGRAQPNRMTWLLWGVLPLIVFVAQRVQGVESLSWASFTSGLTPLLVFGASFVNPKAYWRTQPTDYAVMAAALAGMLLWGITNDPNLAIGFSILADFVAGLPTLIKCYRHPETESWRAYALSAGGFAISLSAVHVVTFQNVAFVAYVFLYNGLMAIGAVRTPRAAGSAA